MTSRSSDLGNIPILPEDIERVIFEMAAELDTSSIPTFLLVAQRIRQWIEPLLYRVMIQAHEKTVPWLNKPNSPNPERFGPYVRHLLLGWTLEAPELERLLSLCPNVEDLALWTTLAPLFKFMSSLEVMPLRRLSVDINHLFESGIPDFRIPIFTNITHLDIISFISEWERWAGIALLPNLTHIALNHGFELDFIKGVLRECQKLELLVLVPYFSYEQFEEFSVPEAGIDDHRLVLMIWHNDQYVADWEAGARGTIDFWKEAELISQAKKNKTFRGESQKWIIRGSFVEELTMTKS